MSQKKSVKQLFSVFCFIGICVLIDQITKFMVVDTLTGEWPPIIKITDFFDIVLTYNYGVSYSWFASEKAITRYVLIGIKLLVILYLFYWVKKEDNKNIKLGLYLIIAGALGNMFDRIYHGGVVDFISLHYGSFQWYIFNIADIYISIGAIILVIAVFAAKRTDA